MKQAENKLYLLKELFFGMFCISAFTFGGGFVIITFMKDRFVDRLHWIDEEEMLDLTALAQSSPGAIAVNAAILMGWRTAGFLGMFAAVLGTILPPMLLLSVISVFYDAFITNPLISLLLKGMQSGAAAVILNVVCSTGGKVIGERPLVHSVILLSAFLLTFFFEVNAALILLAAAAAGVVLAWHDRKKNGEVQS